ncbi:ribosomal-processing cysteine protease Prp [Facklamia sp. DSM 111018]|uniref:Ribosomal processing cysteine protease Prp n=1 Tax=Facklamia lactis TaxID=2749967 RepID=A0ABS0LNA0_9LACT|nr:ribosomal-processing cysteine protease Prp [Facklamia lactis]MBG9979675.1 ribosomal-processing cysteine protease Prp [Facklamia lactis]MBG9985645.1 ribosomal-processing cysteine protease Prp [Facklamia lactis]
MIRIKVEIADKDIVQAIEVTGHADYAEHGQDIVCAAVSSQVISIENSLYQLLHIPVKTKVNESQGGYLKIELPEIESKQVSHDAQLLMKHLIFALEVTAEAYPEYIQIKQVKL